jgi:hypothetical protein
MSKKSVSVMVLTINLPPPPHPGPYAKDLVVSLCLWFYWEVIQSKEMGPRRKEGHWVCALEGDIGILEPSFLSLSLLTDHHKVRGFVPLHGT